MKFDVSSKDHINIRNHFGCNEPRENILAYRFTTWSSDNDEGIVITVNGVYAKVGYDEADFMPYDEARRHGRIIVSDGCVIVDPRLLPYTDQLAESKRYTSGTYKNLPRFLRRIARYIGDFEARENRERELLNALNEVLETPPEIKKPEPPKNWFLRFFYRPKQDVAVYPGLGFGNAELASHLMDLAKLNAQQGHGFAAEMGNNLIDRLMLRDAKIIGGDNALNGADRLVNGVYIQCKYHHSGDACISDCFEDGKFRYPGQVIEVPRDKYDEAVKAMRKRIEKGEVEGVTDPAEAEKLVRKGWLTYKQAMNLAKPLTIESLTFDAVNGAIIGVCAGGISAAFAFAIAKWGGNDNETARKIAFDNFKFVGGIAGVTALISGQISKSKWTADLAIRLFGKKGCNKIAGILGSEFKGDKAAKLVGSTGLALVVQAVVKSVPDFNDYFLKGRISGGQLAKNIFVNVAQVAGAGVGFKIGAGVGMAFGGHDTIGGLIGAIVGGAVLSLAAKWLGDLVIDDDSKEMIRIVNFEIEVLAVDYLWSKEEYETTYKKLSGNLDNNIIKIMYASPDRYVSASNVIVPILEEVASKREKITPPSEDDLMRGLHDLLNEDEVSEPQTQEQDSEPQKQEEDSEIKKSVVSAALRELIKAENPDVDERYIVPSARFGKEIPPYKPDKTKFADDIRKVFEITLSDEKVSSILELGENKTFGELTDYFFSLL